jgi:hypothetical protein
MVALTRWHLVAPAQLLLAGAVAACGSGPATSAPSPSPPAAVVASPTQGAATTAYVALVHDFWNEEQAADVVSNGSNLAAKVCLGMDPPGAPAKLGLVDPSACLARAVALLAVHQKFLSALATTPAPPRFAADDQVFRAQMPRTISDLNALIAASRGGRPNAVLQAATVYNNDMFPSVTDALNDVDPSVSHP